MAIRALSTRTSLTSLSSGVPPISARALVRLPGPVTQAIRTMRAAEPVRTETISVLSDADEAIAAIREGVMRFLAERIEADLALLDALDGDCDLEEDDPAGGDINDEPHDAEEDKGAEEDEGSDFLCTFDGTNYHRRHA